MSLIVEKFDIETNALSDTKSVKNKTHETFTDPFNLIGKRILGGKYFVEKHIDSGGMSEIYLVSYRGNYFVAKVLKSSLATLRQKKAYENEIRTMQRFNHPHILQIIDFGEFDGRQIIVLEYASNGYLYPKLREGNLTFQSALKYFQDVICGLSEIHNHGFIHRDVKPHNIFLFGDFAKLGDFGLAIDLNATVSMGSDSSLNGTINYISPEEIDKRGLMLSPQADIYSFGATMFHTFCGRPLFQGNIFQILKQHVDDNPTRPINLNPNIFPELEELILNCLLKDPQKRPDCKTVFEDIELMLKRYKTPSYKIPVSI